MDNDGNEFRGRFPRSLETMATNMESSNHSIITALAIPNLPNLADFMELGGFSISKLRRRQIFASQIEELRGLIIDSNFPDYPVILCKIPNMHGCVYMEDDIPWHLVFLDCDSANTVDLLRESYLHEASHLISGGEDHDFAFAVAHNAFRQKAGLASSDEEYDYRACDYVGLSFIEAKGLSEQFATIINQASLSSEMIDVVIKSHIAQNMNRCKNADDVSKLMASLPDFVQMVTETMGSDG